MSKKEVKGIGEGGNRAPAWPVYQIEGTSSFDIDQRSSGDRKKHVVATINKIGQPFLEAMQEAYLDRGWRMCGPASIALSRIVATLTDVPLGRNLPGEHLEIAVGIFDPQDSEERLSRMEEQTYIRYYDGQGNVVYIDPIYGLLMQGVKTLEAAIQIEEFTAIEVDTELIKKHNIHPFTPQHPQLGRIKCFSGDTPEEKQAIFDEILDALNDDRATLPAFVSKFGGVHETDWSKTEPVIKKFAPTWQKNLEFALNQLRQASERLRGSRRNTRVPMRGERFGFMSSDAELFPLELPPQKFKDSKQIYLKIAPELRSVLDNIKKSNSTEK